MGGIVSGSEAMQEANLETLVQTVALSTDPFEN